MDVLTLVTKSTARERNKRSHDKWFLCRVAHKPIAVEKRFEIFCAPYIFRQRSILHWARVWKKVPTEFDFIFVFFSFRFEDRLFIIGLFILFFTFLQFTDLLNSCDSLFLDKFLCWFRFVSLVFSIHSLIPNSILNHIILSNRWTSKRFGQSWLWRTRELNRSQFLLSFAESEIVMKTSTLA